MEERIGPSDRLQGGYQGRGILDVATLAFGSLLPRAGYTHVCITKRRRVG
jgi:hypothetical protein